jgi:hypothetical protein
MTTLLDLGSPPVTIAAIVAAAVCAVVAWQTVRTARREAADRVAALVAAIHAAEPGTAEPGTLFRSEGGEARAMFSVYDADLSLSDHAPGDPQEAPAYQPLRTTPVLVAFGAAAMVAVLAGAGLWNAAAPSAPARDQRPLELARLEHGVTADAFTVSGEVGVPPGRPLRGLAVELVTLDRQGLEIASGGAPVTLDVTAPGGRVPFSVSVPYSSAVNRYTIRFRDVSGLQPHVDRRRLQGAVP